VGEGPSSPDLRRVRSGEDFDILIGFVGFWVAVLFIGTAFLEVTGKNALLPALFLLVMVLALWGLVRVRRKLPPRTARRHR
jgi:hypothetical protein